MHYISFSCQALVVPLDKEILSLVLMVWQQPGKFCASFNKGAVLWIMKGNVGENIKNT